MSLICPSMRACAASSSRAVRALASDGKRVKCIGPGKVTELCGAVKALNRYSPFWLRPSGEAASLL